MIRRAVLVAVALTGLPALPAHGAGDPVVHVESFEAAPLGMFGCVTGYPTTYCFAATHTADGATSVTVLRGQFGEPALLVTKSLPRDALRSRPDLGRRVVELTGAIEGIGDFNVEMRARTATIRTTNVGCPTYPLQFALTGDDDEAIGIETSAAATIGGRPHLSRTTVCDAVVLRPSSGTWALTSP